MSDRFPTASNETKRLEALRRYNVLDTPPEVAFDRITHLAARLFKMPIALVSLVDQDRQWLKSSHGLGTSQSDREVAFCAYAILANEVMIVPDATEDPRFMDNPLVIGGPNIRFYAGAPLQTQDGFNLGTLCVIDTVPRELSQEQIITLADLAAMVVDELELRLAMIKSREIQAALSEREARYRLITENSTDMISRHTPEGVYLYASPACRTLLGYEPAELVGHSAYEFFHPEDLAQIQRSHATIVAGPDTYTVRYRIRRKDGTYIWFETTSRTVRDPDSDVVQEIIAASRDISERKAMEQALHKANEKLETKVAKRTTQLSQANAALRQQTQRLQVLHKLIRAINSSLQRSEVYDAFARHASRLLPYDHLSVALVEGDGLRVTYVSGDNGSETNPRPGTSLASKTSAVGWVVKHRQPLLRHDITEDTRFTEDEDLAARGIASSMIIPLWVKGQVIGIWSLGHQGVGAYAADDLEISQAMAGQLATAIDNARLYERATQEIRERQRVAEALSQSEKQYRNLVDNALVGVFKSNLNGELLYANEALVRMLEFESVSQMKAGGVQPLYKNPQDRISLIDQLQRTGQVESFDFEVLTRTGQPKNMLLSAILEGEILSGMMIDVTEGKRAEQALRTSEQRFRLLVDGVKDYAIYMLDPDGYIVNWNAGAKRIKGYQANEIIGQHFSCFYRNEDIQQGKPQQDLQVAATEGRLEEEGWHVRKDGSQFQTNTIITALRDEDGQLQGFSKVTRDITDSRNLEQQLRQAQKMEAIGRLAGGVAHDFNNVLVVITGYSELLLTRHLDEQDPLRKYIEAIKQAGERAAALTRQLLAFSRQQVLELKVLDLNEVVANLEDMLRRLIGEDIDLTMALQPELGQVQADAGQIDQVIMNLAVNARDAMPQGGKLTIETSNVNLDAGYAHLHLEVTPGPYVMLAISDSGTGMDPDTLARIFDPFFTTKELGKGTGLGLATVQGIVKQSNGHLWVYSEPGRGTTFKIYLPRVEEVAETFKPELIPAASLAGSETILVVEDETGVRELVCEILRENGYTVLEAGQGTEALQVYEQHSGPIHLLMTDVIMPGGMSGPELQARLVPLHPELKALYMSGYTDNAILHHEVLQPGIAFIQKPFRPDDLVRKIRETLDTQP